MLLQLIERESVPDATSCHEPFADDQISLGEPRQDLLDGAAAQ
jgi:hypothetical protein